MESFIYFMFCFVLLCFILCTLRRLAVLNIFKINIYLVYLAVLNIFKINKKEMIVFFIIMQSSFLPLPTTNSTKGSIRIIYKAEWSSFYSQLISNFDKGTLELLVTSESLFLYYSLSFLMLPWVIWSFLDFIFEGVFPLKTSV